MNIIEYIFNRSTWEIRYNQTEILKICHSLNLLYQGSAEKYSLVIFLHLEKLKTTLKIESKCASPWGEVFVWLGFSSHWRSLHSYGYFTITREGLQI